MTWFVGESTRNEFQQITFTSYNKESEKKPGTSERPDAQAHRLHQKAATRRRRRRNLETPMAPSLFRPLQNPDKRKMATDTQKEPPIFFLAINAETGPSSTKPKTQLWKRPLVKKVKRLWRKGEIFDGVRRPGKARSWEEWRDWRLITRRKRSCLKLIVGHVFLSWRKYPCERPLILPKECIIISISFFQFFFKKDNFFGSKIKISLKIKAWFRLY